MLIGGGETNKRGEAYAGPFEQRCAVVRRQVVGIKKISLFQQIFDSQTSMAPAYISNLVGGKSLQGKILLSNIFT